METENKYMNATVGRIGAKVIAVPLISAVAGGFAAAAGGLSVSERSSLFVFVAANIIGIWTLIAAAEIPGDDIFRQKLLQMQLVVICILTASELAGRINDTKMFSFSAAKTLLQLMSMPFMTEMMITAAREKRRMTENPATMTDTVQQP